MDLMEVTRSYDISFYNCVMIEGYEVPEPLPDDWEDSLAKLLGDVLPKCELTLYLGYQINKTPYQQVLVKFDSPEDKKIAVELLTPDFKLKIGKEFYAITVFNDADLFSKAAVSKPVTPSSDSSAASAHQYLRRIKPFSGAEKPASGEIDIREWLTLAYELRDLDSPVSNANKFKWLKNSLTKGALILASSSVVTSLEELIQLMALTYGGSHSQDHLLTQLYRQRQVDRERPSAFLVRIQEQLVELTRSYPHALIEPDRFRLDQFCRGLKSSDFDLLDLRLGLTRMQETPTFSDLLREVQSLERDRKERDERTYGSNTQSARQVTSRAVTASFMLEHERVGDEGSDTMPEGAYSSSELYDELKATNKKLAQFMELSVKERPKQAIVHAATVDVKPVREEKRAFRPSSNQRKPQRDFSKVTCWNCGEKGHLVYSCSKELDRDCVFQNLSQLMDKSDKKADPENLNQE